LIVQEHRTRIADHSHAPHRSPSSFPATSALALRRSLGRFPRRRRTMFSIGFAIMLAFRCDPGLAEPAAAGPDISADAHAPFAAFVAEASQRFGIPATWIRAVMLAESFGGTRAVSPKGAIGLMQIMPETWASLRERYALGADPYDVHDNIIAGAAYLRELRDRYGSPGFLAAYNAGPARWEDHLATGQPLPVETRAYLARLVPIVDGGGFSGGMSLASVIRSWTEAPLFPMRQVRQSDDRQLASALPPEGSPSDHRAQDWTALAPQSNGLFIGLSKRDPAR
jgi:soluble lytic murein transglycosylase-like protein